MKKNSMATKPKILIIGHGGTIAMVESDRGLVPAHNADALLDMVPSIREVADVTLVQLDNIDSTNINPSHWSRLTMEIAGHLDDYDGIMVTHGTDTMAYSATAVSFGLGPNLTKPVVFTGSQLPLTSFQTDARANLERAILTLTNAITEGVAEVMIVFNDVVLRGNRTIKTSEARFDAFNSPAYPHLADITATGMTFSPLAKRKSSTKSLSPQAKFDNSIVTVELVPGMRPSLLRTIIQAGECHGLLFKSLGAGNVPNLDEYSLIPIIEFATESNIPVLITTKFVGGSVLPGHYEVGQAALEAGAIPTGDLTDVAAQVKFMWALAQGKTGLTELNEFINTDYVGEISN